MRQCVSLYYVVVFVVLLIIVSPDPSSLQRRLQLFSIIFLISYGTH